MYLGLKTGPAEWKAQTNPLRYGVRILRRPSDQNHREDRGGGVGGGLVVIELKNNKRLLYVETYLTAIKLVIFSWKMKIRIVFIFGLVSLSGLGCCSLNEVCNSIEVS